ncbi:MAG: acetylglutamate kinase [Eubacterium sp.]|nr:acetylglutamate kinase [Eubacterium sp.]
MLRGVDDVVIKAETLIEALPYIRDFNGKKVVVKYGGSAMLDENLQQSVIKDVALLKLVGMKPIIVHGGGKEISKWLGYMGKESKFVEGLRVTDEDTMEVAEMVLSKVNKHLVQMMEKLGVKAAGISGKDGGTMICDKKTASGQDIGFVGEVKKVNSDLIDTLLENDFVPIIAPIGMDEKFQAYNINADDAASAIAKSIKAEKLVFMTDIEGVCMDPSDPETLISVLPVNEAKFLIENGTIGGGMIPKIRNCVEAVEQGVSRVHILDGRQEHCLLLEFYTKKGIGTAIIGDQENLYPHEQEERYGHAEKD